MRALIVTTIAHTAQQPWQINGVAKREKRRAERYTRTLTYSLISIPRIV